MSCCTVAPPRGTHPAIRPQSHEANNFNCFVDQSEKKIRRHMCIAADPGVIYAASYDACCDYCRCGDTLDNNCNCRRRKGRR